MKAQRGKDLLLKLGDAGTPQSFTTVAGLRTRTLSFNAGTVDITHATSEGGWRELLADAAVRQASIAGSGVFLNGESAQSVRALFFAAGQADWQMVIPGLGTIEGPFQIANLDYAGDFDGEATVSMALESAGNLTFTSEAAS